MKPANYYKLCTEARNPELSSEWQTIAKAYEGRVCHNLNHLQKMLVNLPGLSTSIALAAEPIFGIALIYHGKNAREKWEEATRMNLERELNRL